MSFLLEHHQVVLSEFLVPIISLDSHSIVHTFERFMMGLFGKKS